MLDTIIALARLFASQDRQLYMVGGSVRDLLLHRDASPDADLTTDARPDDIKLLVAPTHPDAVVTVGEQFGTVRLHYRRPDAPDATTRDAGANMPPEARDVPPGPEPVEVVAEHDPAVDIIEITTFRSEVYDAVSRKPVVTFGDRLEDDLLRRDFTINAMARNPLSGEIIDPYGGRRDLEAHLIRAVGDDPEHRFDEDPLRLLRAIRFAAQLGFTIEERTLAAIERQGPTLGKISRERIRDEFTRVLVSPDPIRGLRLLVDTGLMAYIVPEVLDLRGVSRAPRPLQGRVRTRAARGGQQSAAGGLALGGTAARHRQAAHAHGRGRQGPLLRP